MVLLGAPGVGKSTLMNRLLADVRLPVGMRPAWLVASLQPISLPSAATLQDFCIEVLRHVLDMRRQMHDAAAHGPHDGRAKVAKTAARIRRTLVAGNTIWDTVTRMIEGALTLSPQGFGMGVSTQFTAPHMGAATWLPLTREAIAALAREADRDVVIAVNNAENLRELLRALEVAIVRLAPLGARTLPLGDAMKVVAHQHAELFRDRMEGAGWAHLLPAALARGLTTEAWLNGRDLEREGMRFDARKEVCGWARNEEALIRESRAGLRSARTAPATFDAEREPRQWPPG